MLPDAYNATFDSAQGFGPRSSCRIGDWKFYYRLGATQMDMVLLMSFLLLLFLFLFQLY